MQSYMIYILIALIFVLIIGLLLYFSLSGSSASSYNEEALRNLILSQRSAKKDLGKQSGSLARGEAAILASKSSELGRETKDISRATIAQKLIFAHWNLTALQYNTIKYAVSGILVAGLTFILEWPLIITIAFLSPKLVDAILNRSLNKRFNNFDRDFPDYLMTIVSRLRSGMNILQAMQTAAKDLLDSSILRKEVELMIERIRVGYQEEKAIGVFADTVPHPEIELFTQVVILNKKVGGNFAATLERLAKQVRKRQDFRRKAITAVAEQKGGALLVVCIMSALLGMIGMTSPELLKGLIEVKIGRVASQFGASMAIMGFYVIRIITAIKV